MSADLMLVCPERNEKFDSNHEKCVIVDETSLGCPHTEFGAMITWQAYREITPETIERIIYWYEHLEHKDYINIGEIVQWLNSHLGCTLNTECW